MGEGETVILAFKYNYACYFQRAYIYRILHNPICDHRYLGNICDYRGMENQYSKRNFRNFKVFSIPKMLDNLSPMAYIIHVCVVLFCWLVFIGNSVKNKVDSLSFIVAKQSSAMCVLFAPPSFKTSFVRVLRSCAPAPATTRMGNFQPAFELLKLTGIVRQRQFQVYRTCAPGRKFSQSSLNFLL